MKVQHDSVDRRRGAGNRLPRSFSAAQGRSTATGASRPRTMDSASSRATTSSLMRRAPGCKTTRSPPTRPAPATITIFPTRSSCRSARWSRTCRRIRPTPIAPARSATLMPRWMDEAGIEARGTCAAEALACADRRRLRTATSSSSCWRSRAMPPDRHRHHRRPGRPDPLHGRSRARRASACRRAIIIC